jgi:hypothetical protein
VSRSPLRFWNKTSRKTRSFQLLNPLPQYFRLLEKHHRLELQSRSWGPHLRIPRGHY